MFRSATIQDYCILGTRLDCFMGLGFWGCGFVNGGCMHFMDI